MLLVLARITLPINAYRRGLRKQAPQEAFYEEKTALLIALHGVLQ